MMKSKVLGMLAVAVMSLSNVQAQEKKVEIGMPPTVAQGASLQVVYEEAGRYFEGPMWDTKTAKLYFTAFNTKDKPTQILRLDAPQNEFVHQIAFVWMNNTQGINGMYLSRDGRLLGAQGRAKPPAIVAMTIGETAPPQVQVLAQGSEQNFMTETNDLAEDSKGGIYFTCPDFGQKTRSMVYYMAPNGELKAAVSNLKLPNGIEVSNDGKTLMVADSFEKRIYAYPINENGELDKGRVRVFFDPDTPNQADPDGMTCDADGNWYFAMRGGVWCADSSGKTIGFIPVDKFVSNVIFGGADGQTLYLTCQDRVYSLKMNARRKK